MHKCHIYVYFSNIYSIYFFTKYLKIMFSAIYVYLIWMRPWAVSIILTSWYMTSAAPMINLASPNLSSKNLVYVFCPNVFMKLFFFWRNFFFGQNFFLFGETLFGQLHLVKLHLANFIWQNFIWRLTLATPVVLIFFQMAGQTYIHTHAQLYYR